MNKRTNTAVWWEKHKRWQINVQKDGIRRSFYSCTLGRKGQRECHAKADAWLDDNITDANIKCSVLYTNWIDKLKEVSSTAHWTQYESYGNNWIIPQIGKLQIGKLNEEHLQSIIDKGYAKKLSKKTLSNIRACLVSWIKYCRKRKATTLFPEDLNIPRGATKKERSILQPKDITILFSSDKTLRRGEEIQDYLIYAYRFAVLTGLRPGELIGLKKEDIKNNVVHLKRSINHLKEETRGKNENARRSFALSPLAKDILKSQAKMLKDKGITSEYVFPDPYGDPLKQDHYSKRWAAYRDYNKLTKVTPYELRHSFVSIVKSLPPGLLKPLIGHSQDMDTYGIYSHEIQGDMAETAGQINDIFNKILNQNDDEK